MKRPLLALPRLPGNSSNKTIKPATCKLSDDGEMAAVMTEVYSIISAFMLLYTP